MIKIFHEAPKSIFKQVQEYTDGDYALVHLFEKDPEYFRMFEEAVKEGREVILDNSVFELEKAFDPERFVYWINRLNPTYYIVPDVLENYEGTRKNMEDWIENWLPKVQTNSKIIGVIQGDSFQDVCKCYSYLDSLQEVSKIAISFDYSLYQKMYPHPNKLISWALGRVKLLGDLSNAGILNKQKPHHLLGCAIPGEGIFYSSPEFDYIDSIDTSNPVVHGIKKIRYDGPLGLTTKETQKLCELIDSNVNSTKWSYILYNLREFRYRWNGRYGVL